MDPVDEDAGRSLNQCRYIIVLVEFFVYFQINTYRLATSISVVAMTNNSAIKSHTNFNSSSISCPLIVEGTPQNSYSREDGEFHWNPSIQGYILGAGFFGYTLTQIPGGIFAEAYGAKITVVGGLLISTLAHLLSPYAAWNSILFMIVIQLLRGIGQGVLIPAASVLSAKWFPSTERGFLNTLILSGYILGALVAGASAGSMCSSSFLGGWPSTYYIYGSLGLVLCCCCQLFLFESPKSHPRIKRTELNYILKNQERDLSQEMPPVPWKEMLTSVPVYATMYGMFGVFWMGTHLILMQSIFLGTILHFSIKDNGYFISVPLVLQVLFAFLGSWISKWLNTNNYVGVTKVRKGCNFLSCFGYSLGLLGIYYSGCNRTLSSSLHIIAMSFTGFSFSGSMITPVDMSPTFAGTLMGLSYSVSTFAAFIFPVLVGTMTNEQQTLEQWNKIILISIGIVMSSGIIFCVFGSAEVQHWNFPSNEEKYLQNKKNINEYEKLNNPAESTTAI